MVTWVSPTDEFTEQPRFAYLITNPVADFIAVHFTHFNLPESDYVQIRPADPASSETHVLQYRGNETNGSFYATALSTSAVIVELFTESANHPQAVNTSQCMGFSVDSYQYLAQGSTQNGSKEEVCGADNSREAACYKSFNTAFQTSNTVVRLLIKKPEGAFFCTDGSWAARATLSPTTTASRPKSMPVTRSLSLTLRDLLAAEVAPLLALVVEISALIMQR